MNYRAIRWVPLSILLLLPGFLKANEAALAPLVEYLVGIAEPNHAKPVPIVAIGGCPGAGKTYLAKILVSLLEEKGVRCAILPLDHFNLSLAERNKIGTEWDIRHFKPAELQRVLSAISPGARIIAKPICNQLTGETGSELLDLRDVDLVLFDGLYALCTEPPLNFFGFCTAGVFVEADESDIYKWKWEREQKKTVPRTKAQFALHMKALMEEFERNIVGSRKNALFLIKKGADHSYEVEPLPCGGALRDDDISCKGEGVCKIEV